MREISSKEYAELVDDVVTDELEQAVSNIARRVGLNTKTYVNVNDVVGGFWFGPMATVRDQVIELLELNGMDVRSDGRDY